MKESRIDIALSDLRNERAHGKIAGRLSILRVLVKDHEPCDLVEQDTRRGVRWGQTILGSRDVDVGREAGGTVARLFISEDAIFDVEVEPVGIFRVPAKHARDSCPGRQARYDRQ